MLDALSYDSKRFHTASSNATVDGQMIAFRLDGRRTAKSSR
jgi:chaperone required for assembly of F1-ATPase